MLPIARPRHHAANAVHPPASQHGVFNAGWMLVALLFTCAWWIGLWDLHAVRSWDIGSIAFYFSIAAGIYLYARLVSPRIPESGEIDLQRFHSEEGRKYLTAYTVLGVVTVVANAVLGQAAGVSQWTAQNIGPSRTGGWSRR